METICYDGTNQAIREGDVVRFNAYALGLDNHCVEGMGVVYRDDQNRLCVYDTYWSAFDRGGAVITEGDNTITEAAEILKNSVFARRLESTEALTSMIFVANHTEYSIVEKSPQRDYDATDYFSITSQHGLRDTWFLRDSATVSDNARRADDAKHLKNNIADAFSAARSAMLAYATFTRMHGEPTGEELTRLDLIGYGNHGIEFDDMYALLGTMHANRDKIEKYRVELRAADAYEDADAHQAVDDWLDN